MKKELANMVTNTHWNYAIFWTLSSTQHGVIEWGEGYYNGESKEKKTTSKSSEFETNNHVGLQRSEQLRNLYESLLHGKVGEQGKKGTSPSLCLEEISNLEWYYLLCMSFTFKYGQSLPGRAYITGQYIWLCEAQTTDSNVFTRSLLAKSASVQTVICFPYMGGVIELGSTNLISEDLMLIEHLVKRPRLDSYSTMVNQEDANMNSTDNLENLNLNTDYRTGMNRVIEDQNMRYSGYLIPLTESPETLEGTQDGLHFGMDMEGRSSPAIEDDIMELLDIEVRFVNDEVIRVELSCVWREYLLVDILKALHDLNLDTFTVQSSTFCGALFLSLEAKFRGAAFATEGMIKQALRNIASMY